MKAHNIEIDGLTCVLRSRTWSIQMKNSSDFVYDDLRVIGGNPNNANQDGIDWMGTWNGLVRDSFFRASDDVIALLGNWDGYNEADMLRPGQDVHDITIETSELSTSVSNIVRAGSPQKIFNSHNFTLRDSDILHAGIGACGQTFGLLGFWGANGAHGEHSNYTFENLFLDNWYSLAQIEQEQLALHDFTFRNIWALDQPPLAGSSIKGQVNGVVFENVEIRPERRLRKRRHSRHGRCLRGDALHSAARSRRIFHRRSARRFRGPENHLYRQRFAAHQLHLALRRRLAGAGPQGKPHLYPTPRERTSMVRMEPGDSACFCRQRTTGADQTRPDKIG